MTHDEIRKMEPGPALDALVAERVMGIPKPEDPPLERLAFRGEYDHILKPWIAEFHGGNDVGEWIPQPYSTELKWAWKVVEEVTRASRQVDGMPWGTRFMFHFESGHVWAMNAREAAEWICKWALIAITPKTLDFSVNI